MRSPAQSLVGEDERIRRVEQAAPQPAANLESALVPRMPAPGGTLRPAD